MLFLVFVLEYFACSTPNNQQIKANQPNLTTNQDINRPSTHQSIPAPTNRTPGVYLEPKTNTEAPN
jgi:hypothetical protein